jgi:dynein heavy chain, axonemal
MQAYNEMWVLHYGPLPAGGFKWENITEQLGGTPPPPRFDHCAFIYPVTPNSPTYDKLVILGGRDLSSMFQDSHGGQGALTVGLWAMQGLACKP